MQFDAITRTLGKIDQLSVIDHLANKFSNIEREFIQYVNVSIEE